MMTELEVFLNVVLWRLSSREQGLDKWTLTSCMEAAKAEVWIRVFVKPLITHPLSRVSLSERARGLRALICMSCRWRERHRSIYPVAKDMRFFVERETLLFLSFGWLRLFSLSAVVSPLSLSVALLRKLRICAARFGELRPRRMIDLSMAQSTLRQSRSLPWAKLGNIFS